MQPLSGNQRPDLPTSLMNMSFVLRLPRKMHLWRSWKMQPLSVGQMRDEQLRAVAARSTVRSQNAQNTPCLDRC